MMPPWVAVTIAIVSPVLTVFGIVYAAGRTEGRASARLDAIELRLSSIEGILKRLGFPFREHARDDDR